MLFFHTYCEALLCCPHPYSLAMVAVQLLETGVENGLAGFLPGLVQRSGCRRPAWLSIIPYHLKAAGSSTFPL